MEQSASPRIVVGPLRPARIRTRDPRLFFSHFRGCSTTRVFLHRRKGLARYLEICTDQIIVASAATRVDLRPNRVDQIAIRIEGTELYRGTVLEALRKAGFNGIVDK